MVDEWSAFLPVYSDLFAIMSNQPAVPNAGSGASTLSTPAGQSHPGDAATSGRVSGEPDLEDDQDDEDDGEGIQ